MRFLCSFTWTVTHLLSRSLDTSFFFLTRNLIIYENVCIQLSPIFDHLPLPVIVYYILFYLPPIVVTLCNPTCSCSTSDSSINPLTKAISLMCFPLSGKILLSENQILISEYIMQSRFICITCFSNE